MSTTRAVSVAPLPPIPGRDALTYAVPPALAPRVRDGARVLVPLAQRQVTGIVVGRAEDDGSLALKPLLDVLDDAPLLTSDLLALCRFAASYYMVPLGEVLATAVLAGLRAESRRTVRLGAPLSEPGSRPLGRVERAIVERLSPGRAISVTSLGRSIRSKALYDALRSLAARGLVVIEETPPRARAQALYERVLRLGRELTPEEGARLAERAKAQWDILARLRSAGPSGLVAADLGAAAAAPLRALIARSLVTVDTRETYRPVVNGATRPDSRPEPTGSQRQVIEAVIAASSAARFEVFLLRGVTGSGKTEVYLQAAERVLAAGRGVLVLVPEIALTHDLVSLVYSRFGSTVALLHSALSAGERFDEWRRLARREARVAIGVRSAVFAPVGDLGLVVVDEEHDGAYKQEDGLRYNARDLAIVRARNASCPVLLGSATPSIESFWSARSGRYRLLELAERIEKRPLPAVELIDLRREHPEGDPPVFAPRLAAALAENLAGGGQSLLFVNRRGYAPYLQCVLCGHVMGCPNCSVTLTFHLRSRLLRCHHCDYRIRAPDLCPECASPSLRDFGIGTEQVELVVRRLLPRARVARLDRDAVGRRGALGRILEDWRAGATDVLIGTQMVTKGHDVPGVTLVGVVVADQALNFPDFRAAERTFQMLTQVAGRAGRGSQPGRVLVQTYRPGHYALGRATEHDFVGFAEDEIRHREALDYPPFSRVVNVRLDGPDPVRVEAVARDVAGELRAASARLARGRQATILGPAPAPIERIRRRHRWHVLLKGRDAKALRSAVRLVVESAQPAGRAREVRITIDVDPYNML